MHVYMRLIQLFPFIVFMGGSHIVPPGFKSIITSRGNYVVTSRSNYVIANS